MTDRFDWNPEDIVVRAVERIAIYTNPDGDVVIRQQGPLGEDDDCVIFPIGRIDDVIAALGGLKTASRN